MPPPSSGRKLGRVCCLLGEAGCIPFPVPSFCSKHNPLSIVLLPMVTSNKCRSKSQSPIDLHLQAEIVALKIATSESHLKRGRNDDWIRRATARSQGILKEGAVIWRGWHAFHMEAHNLKGWLRGITVCALPAS